MPRITMRDLVDRQHGKSRAIRDLTPLHGGWLGSAWCRRCEVPLTTTDLEAKRCTQCGLRTTLQPLRSR